MTDTTGESRQAPRVFHDVQGYPGSMSVTDFLMCGHRASGESHLFYLGDLRIMLCDGCWSVIGVDFIRFINSVRTLS